MYASKLRKHLSFVEKEKQQLHDMTCFYKILGCRVAGGIPPRKARMQCLDLSNAVWVSELKEVSIAESRGGRQRFKMCLCGFLLMCFCFYG